MSDQLPDHRNSARRNGRLDDLSRQYPSDYRNTGILIFKCLRVLRLARAIIGVRLRLYRGYPVISSKGESCAIQDL